MFVQHILGRHRKLLASIVVSGAIKGCGALFTFLSFVAVARATSVEEFGRFSIAFALATIVSFFLLGGQHRIVLKYFPKYELADDDGASARFTLRAASRNLAGFIVAGALCLVLLVLAAGLLDVRLATDLPATVLILTLVLAIVLSLAEFLSNYYRARELLVFGLLPRDVIWRLLICAIFGILLFEASGLQLSSDLMSSTEALVLVSTLLLISTGPQLVGWVRGLRSKLQLSEERKREILGEIRHSTIPFWGIALVWPIQSQIGVLFVGFLLGEAEVGAYFSAQKLSGLLAIISVGINQAIAPKLARAVAQNDRADLRHTFVVSCVIGGVISLIALGIYLAFGDRLLAIFDPVYASFYGVLVILCLGQVVFNVSGPAAHLLSFAGKERLVLAVTTAAAIVGIIAICASTIVFGVYGTAIAVALTTLSWNLFFFCVAARYLWKSEEAMND